MAKEGANVSICARGKEDLERSSVGREKLRYRRGVDFSDTQATFKGTPAEPSDYQNPCITDRRIVV